MIINGFDFRETCGSCPEQYDVFDFKGNQVAYIRLRWGTLQVSAPDCNGDTIYEHSYNDGWLGSFPSDEERTNKLNRIANILNARVYGEG